MKTLAGTDTLPLTCTRDGVCCHGHQIWVNPWEVAVLAAGANLAPRDFAAKYLDCRATRLAFDGPPDKRGKRGCRIYSADSGCTLHPHRPLTCRVYPLGRGRTDGVVNYYHTGEALPCLELCPTVTALPSLTVDDYLAGQDIARGEAATDAYARVVYGLVAVAGRLCELGGAEIDRARVVGFVDECRSQTREQRATILPDQWMELATMPAGIDHADPVRFAEAHGQLMTSAVQRAASQIENGLTQAAILHVALAMHLAPSVGAELPAMRNIIAPAA